MTQPAPTPQTVDIGQQILAMSGVDVAALAKLPQAETFVDLRGSTWALHKAAASHVFAGHTVIYISADDGDADVRIYGAPVPRPNMGAVETKAMRDKAGIFVVWTMRRDTPSMIIKTIADPESFAKAVAKEIRDDFDAFTENDDEVDVVLEYLRGLPVGATVADAIKGIENGEHQGEDEEEEPEEAANGASPQPTA